jgi:capsular exopolysaccharide synthesis family protein
MESANQMTASPSVNERVDRRLVTLTAPACGAAEQFRMLHLRLDRIRARQKLGVVAVTSAVAGEGKSITVANLAACAARRGRRAVLVDCDLRRPQIAELLGVEGGPGLASVLGGRSRLEEAMRIGPAGLTVIAGGEGPDDPAGLFQGEGFLHLVERLRQTFQEIYLDLPPVLPFADALAAAGSADGVILVVRGSRTPARLAEEAVDQLAGTPLLGTVLTACGSESTYRKYQRHS